MQQQINGRIIKKKSVDSQCKKCWMDTMWTCQQAWIHCTAGITNKRSGKSTRHKLRQKPTWTTEWQVSKRKKLSKVQPWTRELLTWSNCEALSYILQERYVPM